jgi:hemerythrin-like metal-binding protein
MARRGEVPLYNLPAIRLERMRPDIYPDGGDCAVNSAPASGLKALINGSFAVFEWKESYTVGDARMDAQHKGLIALINQLGDKAQVDDALRKLDRYVAEHFRAEERLLEESGYPDVEKHKEQHAVFEAWLENKRKEFDAGKGSESAHLDIQGYLKIWLVNHILFTDKAYSKHLAAA